MNIDLVFINIEIDLTKKSAVIFGIVIKNIDRAILGKYEGKN